MVQLRQEKPGDVIREGLAIDCTLFLSVFEYFQLLLIEYLSD